MKTTLDITGMHCASCVKLVNRALKKVPGVTQVESNFLINKAYIEHEGNLDEAKAKQEVEAIGYGLRENKLPQPTTHNSQPTTNIDPALLELKESKHRMLLAWA
ncbi:MAG: heavy metal-associated domain-containing protein, partial [Patescibacteria group bacterium]